MAGMNTLRAVAGRTLLWAAGVALLVMVAVAVMWREAPQSAASAAISAPAPQAPQLPGDKRLAAWAQQLQMQLAKQPSDVASWRLLAQAHTARGDLAQAVTAWQRALALDAQHADSHAGLAQTLAALEQGRLSGAAEPWITSGLRLAPEHPALLALAGELALEKGNRPQALAHFERLLAVEQSRGASGADAARLQAIRARVAAVNTADKP